MPAVQNLSETYEADGVLPRVDVFSGNEISGFRAQFDELEAREGRDVCQVGLLRGVNRYRHHTLFPAPFPFP